MANLGRGWAPEDEMSSRLMIYVAEPARRALAERYTRDKNEGDLKKEKKTQKERKEMLNVGYKAGRRRSG